MAIYILALVILPCNDTCASDEHNTPLTISQAQDHHDEDQDLCSPLCACSCCSSQVIIPTGLSLTILVHGLSKDFSAYSAIDITGPLYSIWQPPRLS